MPPIQITRAEYERKFGVKPIASPMSILEDEKPAPIRITRAEWNALQQQWNPQPQTYAQDAKSDIAETKSAVLATADRGATVSGGISNRVASGDTSKVKGMFQKFGNSLLSTGGMVLDVGIGAAKSILPQKAEDSVKKFFEGFGNEITEYNKDFYEKKLLPDLQSNDPDTRNAAKLIVETLDAYKNDADFRDTVNASGGIVGALFATKVKDGVSNTLDTAIDTSKKGFNTAKEVVEPIKKKFDERNFNGFTEELSKIESKNVKTRNANTFAKDIDGSTRRIYESNVLDGSVDNNGLLQTKVAGGAIDQYKAQTIDGFEDIVKRKLEDTKETMPFADVGKALKIEIGRSGLEGADLVTALKKIENELKGLAVRTKGSSIIDLTYLQDAKIATTRNINYLTPPEKATYRKAVARAYKVLIEKNSTKFDVKAVNEGPLARAYEDIARLERLDGARAEGGRLGKYTASLAGTLIGGAAGSVGGGVGAAIGGVVGGELAQAMKGAGMARTFKGGGKGLTPDPLLVRTKLSIPDKPVRANVKEGVKKTKEITDLESQIAKNVADQKKAIKKGDFALVQALKEIYEVLVDELKKAVKYLNDNASVGMSIRDITKNNPLYTEARKYKTAEEFVKKQPVVYHGSGVPLKKFSNEQGTFFTDDMMNADGYAGGENVYEGYLNLKNPLVIDAKGALHRELDTKWGKTTQEVVGNVEKTKYDGVIFKNIKDSWIDDAEVDTPSTIYYAFKPKDSFLNESQLTDIWKKANRKASEAEK